jgi:cytochrome P450
MTMAPHLHYDPTSPSVQADPYPYYARLRAHDPVQWNERLQVWVISRHPDVMGMLRDPRWSSNYLNSVLNSEDLAELRVKQSAWHVLLFMDAPEHTEMRRAVAKSFDAPMVGDLGTYARNLAIELLDSFRGRDEIDLMGEFAVPLLLRVIARLLGVPDNDLAIIAESAHELSGLVDWTPSAEALNRAGNRGAALTPYLFGLIEQKRRAPGKDLVSALVQQAKQRRIRYLDVVSTAVLMVAAGHVTSTHMIGNGMLALLRDRQAFEACKSGRYPTSQIVEELLRFDAPVQATPRTALANFELGGRNIRRGDMALGLIGSANRDSSAFIEPDRLDPGRHTGIAASFGGGPHFCVGAPIARVVGAVALEELWRRYPQIQLSQQELKWKPTITQRGLTTLRVAL